MRESQPIAVGIVAAAEANQRPAESEHGDGAPGKQAKPELLDEVIEGRRRSTRAGHPAQKQREFAGDVGGGEGQREHQDADGRHGDENRPAPRPLHEKPTTEGYIARNISSDAGRGKGWAAVCRGGSRCLDPRSQTEPDQQGSGHGQAGQSHAKERAAR